MNTVKYRVFEQEDLQNVASLLSGLKNYYPGFEKWLVRKTSEPKTFCYIAEVDRTIVGVVISAPENNKTYKISTLFVHPDFRNKKVGTTLVKLAHDNASSYPHMEQMFITSDKSLLPTLGEWLHKTYGFVPLYAEPNRYIEGHAEVFYFKKFRKVVS